MQAWIRLGSELYKFLMYSGVKFSHTRLMAQNSSSGVRITSACLRKERFNFHYRFSMIFKSGDCAGHVM